MTYEVGQREVADAGEEVDDGLAAAVEGGHAQLLRDVSGTEHGAGDVPRVHHPVVRPGGPPASARNRKLCCRVTRLISTRK